MNTNNEKDAAKTVAIIIDKKEHRSPNPTTGLALYGLGSVDSAVYDLYREVRGQGDDELISATDAQVRLKNGDHFYSMRKKLNPGAHE